MLAFLITFRAVQGIGGAAMFATSLALLAHEFRGRDRGVALGVWGDTAGVAAAVGPLVGGALTRDGQPGPRRARVRPAFVAALTARDPRLAGRAQALAGSLTSGGAGAHSAAGKVGHAVALATWAAFVSGSTRSRGVAAISAALLRTRSISSEPELSVSDEEVPDRRAA